VLKKSIQNLACGMLLAATVPAAHAQPYPNHPLKLIVPFAAGGSADVVARIFGQALAAQFGQAVVIDNRGGGGGVIGIDAMAKSPRDGYSLGLANATGLSAAQFMTDKLPYDSDKDLALITIVARVPEVLVANARLGYANTAALVAYAKANPGKLNYGSAGASSIIRLAMELFKSEAGIDIVHVPYKGIGPAVTDLLAGQVQVTIADVPAVLPHIRSGSFKALAITSARRVPMLPEVPTMAEVGYPKVLSDNWYGLVAPAGTPPEILRRLNSSAVAALQSAEAVQQLAVQGTLAAPCTPAEFQAALRVEKAKWGPIVKANNIRLE
jgi:tripartite-type tricarboxylate transporter receptor subunit TctC